MSFGGLGNCPLCWDAPDICTCHPADKAEYYKKPKDKKTMPYDNVVKCPCGKSWVPKGFEHQCLHCKGKRSVPDLWAEMCNAKPSYPVDLTMPTNSKPSNLPLTPKKGVVRISLPPKPKTSAENLRLMQDAFDELFTDPSEKVGSKSTDVRKDFKLNKDSWKTEETLDTLYNEMLDRQEGADIRELIDDVVEEERRKEELEVRKAMEMDILKKVCQCCGNERVIIRGRYPQDSKRIVCPTCLAMRLETIRELVNNDHWQIDLEKKR